MVDREKEKEIEATVKQRVEARLPQKVNEALDAMPRRTFLVRSGMLGITAIGVGAAAGGALGFIIGTGTGAQEERARLFPRGELSPELEKKLLGANHSIVEIQGWTAANLREIGLTGLTGLTGFNVPDFPFPIPEGESDPQDTPSRHKWIAIRQAGIYLPREEDDTFGDLAADIRTANTAAGRIDSNLIFEAGDLSDFLEAELISLRDTEQSIFQKGHVITSHQFEIGGITNGIAIGRETPESPITIIPFDASREALLPANVSAGGFVVAK